MPKDGRKSLNEGTCTIKRHKDLEADMNQLRKNNERLLEKNQQSETRIHEQQQKINEYESNRRYGFVLKKKNTFRVTVVCKS